VNPTVFTDLDLLLTAAPMELGVTDWIEVDEEAIADFARATLVPSRPDAASPLMILSLSNRLLPELLQVPAASSGVNYGAASVRFGPEVKAGGRVRASASLVESTEVTGGVQTLVEIRIEAEGCEEPACVIGSLSRWLR
jgi:acyl dehydratase